LNAVAYKEVMGAKWEPKVKTGENKKFLNAVSAALSIQSNKM